MTVIIDYGAGNPTSVRLALERLGVSAIVSGDRYAARDAVRIVFPGVGAIGSAMRRLSKTGLDGALKDAVERGIPFLGICLGAQIIFERSEEDGGTTGLGLLPGTVKAFDRERGSKIPQIGWNSARFRREHPLLNGITDESQFYFVHGYYPVPADHGDVIAETDYAGETFASLIGRRNLAACQFHPERSGRIGLKLLENFLRWNGES